MPGMITGILHQHQMEKARAVTAAELMTSPACTVRPDDTVEQAARLMYLRNVKRLPVVDADGRLAGIVSRADVLAVYNRTDAEIAEEIRTGIAVDRVPRGPRNLRRQRDRRRGHPRRPAANPRSRDTPSSAGPATSKASSPSATASTTRPPARTPSTSSPASRSTETADASKRRLLADSDRVLVMVRLCGPSRSFPGSKAPSRLPICRSLRMRTGRSWSRRRRSASAAPIWRSSAASTDQHRLVRTASSSGTNRWAGWPRRPRGPDSAPGTWWSASSADVTLFPARRARRGTGTCA